MNLRVLLALGLVLCAPFANAQSTRARLDDLELRMGQVEGVVRGQALVELSQRIDALEAEARALRGDLDVLEKDTAQLRQQQIDVVADFERRLAALEARATVSAESSAPETKPVPADTTAPAASGVVEAAAPVPATPSAQAAETVSPEQATAPALPVQPASTTQLPAPAQPAPATSPPLPSETPEVAYGRAFDSLKAARYADAIAGMSNFIARHPGHPLVDNAQYWLGQTYYVTRDYPKAVEAFALVVERAPESSKAPDALLKRGLCEIELARSDAARATLNEVIRRYPQNDAARIAREQLTRIR